MSCLASKTVAFHPARKNGAIIGKYLSTWTIRGLLLVLMHQVGVTRLGGASEVGVSQFAKSFPDANAWFGRLPERGGAANLKAFFESLDYDGPPEVFSMFACILLGRDFEVTPEWLMENESELQASMRKLRKSDAIYQVPARCVLDVRRISPDK